MRKHALKFWSLLSVALAVALLAPMRAAADDDDPPSRVARLSLVDGEVSFNPAGTDDWVAATINRPMTTGDKLWTDKDSRAEMHIGSGSIRLGSTTGFSFLNLSDDAAQLQLTEGTLRVRVKRLEENETFEIDAPNLAFSILRPGIYRVNVNEAGDSTVVTVEDGEGEVTGGGQAFTIHANETGAFTGTDQLESNIGEIAESDDFDAWCAERDQREDHSISARYVAPGTIGYEDLDEYGGWRPVPEYGTVWFPHVTVVGWAPYHYGHWAYIAPWGYTWIDDAPWGFAPFHYGRWLVVGGVWGWVPAPPPMVGVAFVRPVYAPALVAWVGGPHFAVGIGIGGGFAAGVNVGWFPLGPREVYMPSYAVSRTYVNNVNITNTTVNRTVVNNYYNNTVVNKNVNVTNVHYMNQGVPGAVTATTPRAFTSAQPVARNAVAVNAQEVAHAPVAASAPAAVPQRQSVLGGAAQARVQPPAAVANRTVVAKATPPPPPPSFAKQQAAIRQNSGRPLAAAQVRQIQPQQARAAAAVRMAPPAKPAIAGNNGNRAVQPQGNVNPNRPNNSGNQAGNAAGNAVNRPNGAQPNNAGNRPSNAQANGKTFNDRPPASRPGNQNNQTAALAQKHQQEREQLNQQQDQERQRVEQQQQQERQQAANEAQRQQLNQKHQQQLQQLEQKHGQQQQKLNQRQQQERQKSQPEKPPKKS